jgi:hypothetical protein
LERADGVGIRFGHPFYQRLNELVEAESFDEFVESLPCFPTDAAEKLCMDDV